MRTQKEIEEKKRERFEFMALRLAHFMHLSEAETFEDLPAQVRVTFNGLKYHEVVLPLMDFDKSNGLSVRQLEIKYGIPKSTVQYHLSNWRKKIASNLLGQIEALRSTH